MNSHILYHTLSLEVCNPCSIMVQDYRSGISDPDKILVWFVLFNDTWSQLGYLVSCMTILFSKLAHHQIRH